MQASVYSSKGSYSLRSNKTTLCLHQIKTSIKHRQCHTHVFKWITCKARNRNLGQDVWECQGHFENAPDHVCFLCHCCALNFNVFFLRTELFNVKGTSQSLPLQFRRWRFRMFESYIFMTLSCSNSRGHMSLRLFVRISVRKLACTIWPI